nr:hypothetical protein [bacterium]
MKKFPVLLGAAMACLALCGCGRPAATPVLPTPPAQSTPSPQAGGPTPTDPLAARGTPAQTLYDALAQGAPDDALMLIINQPTGEQLSAAARLETWLEGDDANRVLLVPRYGDARAQLWEMQSHTDGTFTRKTMIWDYDFAAKDGAQAIHTAIFRPQSAPLYKLYLKTAQAEGEFLFACNGGDNTGRCEYVLCGDIDDMQPFPFGP